VISRRRTCVLVAAGCAAALLLPAEAAADSPAGTAISPAGSPSAVPTQVVPLAGDAAHLVYGQSQVLGDGETGPAELEVYDGAGTPTDLGQTALIASGYASRFSLSGDILTTANDEPAPYQHVTWWNLATHTTGTSATLPGAWAGSASDGWYYTQGGAVYDESTASVVSLVAQAFPSAPGESIIGGYAGPGGVVVAGDQGDLTYVEASGSLTELDVRWPSFSFPDDFVKCAGTSASETVCVEYAASGDSSVPVATRWVPLDGDAAATAPSQCDGAGAPSVAFVGTTLVCADGVVVSHPAVGALQTSTYSVGTGIGYGAPQVIAALSSAVVANPAQTELMTVTTADSPPSQLLTAPPSDVSVGDFSLTPGRIIWTSDQPAPNSPRSTAIDVWQSTVSAVGGSLSVGPASVVAPKVGWKYLAASGDTTVYSKSVAVDGLAEWTARVVTPQRTSTVAQVLRQSVSVSGNLMLYRTTETPAYPKGRYLLFDGRTGTSKPVSALNAAYAKNVDLDPSRLAGDFVAYVDGKTLYRLNVLTGARAAVARGKFRTDYSPLTVYGPYVGWTQGTGDVTGGDGHSYFRNATSMGAPVELPSGSFIEAMSDSGIVIDRLDDWHPVGNGILVPNTYYLRGYGRSAAISQILSAPGALAVAQVSGSVIAWIDADSVLRAVAL
jgi:hypothetical protein